MKTNVININGVDVELEGNPFDNSVTTSKVADKAITRAKLADVLTNEIDGKYVKPRSGVPASDIEPGVIPDVSQFITKSVNDLVNYYLKSDTYTKAEVQTLIDAVKQFAYEVVETLPTASAGTMHKIYLVPSTKPESENIKDEYITIQSGSTYFWEQIGSTAIDLSGYSTTEQMNAAIASAIAPYKTESQIKAIIEAYGYETAEHASATYQPKEAGKGLSSNDYTNEEKEKVGTALQPAALNPYAKKGGYYQTLSAGYADKAGNLDSWESRDEASVENESRDRVRTTGGSESINGAAGARLLAFVCRGVDYTPTKIISSGVNLLRLQSSGGLAVAVGAGWYFPVPKLTATNDSIGTANENNGVLFVNSVGQNITPTVRFKALADGVPTSINDGVACSYIDKNGKRHYTTSGAGYLIVSGITYASTCARMAWSTNYDKFVSPTDELDAGTIVNCSDVGTLRSVGLGGILVSDRVERISDTQMRKTVNVGVSTSLTWTDVQDIDSEGEPTGNYTHTATIAGMLIGGVADIKLSGASEPFALAVAGNAVSFVDTNETVASGYAVKYQLEVPTILNINVGSVFANISDWGVEYLEASGDGGILWRYAQGIPDSVYGLLAKREVENEVIARTFAYLKEEIVSLNERLKNYGDIIRMAVVDSVDYKTCGKPMFLECSTAGAPAASRIPNDWDEDEYGVWTGVPPAPHSFYYDITSKKVYFAPRCTNSTADWILLN